MIKTEGLTKRYGALTAVDHVSFTVQSGEVLGFLGPNGAGKTTTMRMIAGFIEPTSGTASICGHDVLKQPLAAKAALGYLPEGAPGYGEMTVDGFLRFAADLRGLQRAQRAVRLRYVIERLELGSVLTQTLDTLSKGFRRRVGLAQALVHDPPVLILDEPTDGLDPNQKHEVRSLISEMARSKLIVISTHILEEVEAVCTRAIIIARGRIVADDTPQGLAAQSRYHGAVSVRLRDAADHERARAALAALPAVAELEYSANEARLTAIPRNGGGAPLGAAVGDALDRSGIPLRSLAIEAGRL
ncbi:MAG: ABC transporter ATP-binding protein, partial [Gammaproteobacteria bacterium]|nr:ABC transporter ATP-binding protein [Gammaproteobacteria bacterium]